MKDKQVTFTEALIAKKLGFKIYGTPENNKRDVLFEQVDNFLMSKETI